MRKYLFIFAALVLGFASIASAQATRTWVSGVGDDANPCSRTAPCKTFAGAISKTAAGGEINVIDPGGFGGVTITKALTIDGTPFQAGVLVAGTTGITVNAGAGDSVTLRGLTISGSSNPTVSSGIRILSAKAVHVLECNIFNFAGKGIDANPSVANFELFVTDTNIRNNGGSGIFTNPSVGIMRLIANHVRVQGNTVNGIELNVNTAASVIDSDLSGNAQAGLAINGVSDVSVTEHTSLTNNNNGISNAGSTARISNCMITNNATNGILNSGGGTVVGFTNNTVVGNGGLNTVSSSVGQQ
jgi:hypothetical protein